MDSEKRRQLELLPEGEPHIEVVTPELVRSIRRRSTFLGAWNLAQDISGLENKQCYQPLGIDSSHWTKIRNGSGSPPADERFGHYFDIVQNEIPLIWLAESRGYDWLSIRKHQSSEQARIAELEAELSLCRKAMQLWVESQKGRG